MAAQDFRAYTAKAQGMRCSSSSATTSLRRVSRAWMAKVQGRQAAPPAPDGAGPHAAVAEFRRSSESVCRVVEPRQGQSDAWPFRPQQLR